MKQSKMMRTKMQALNVCLLFSVIISFGVTQGQVISDPDDVTVCEGREAVFTCVLNSNIRSGDVQWYRFIKDNSTTVMIDPDGENINFITNTIGNTTSSSLSITNVMKSYTGYFWVGIPSLNVCNSSLTVLTGPSALIVNIAKNIESSSIDIQWDAADDSLITVYIVTWSRDGDSLQVHTLTEQTSYTITGLILDTVYTVTVTAANMCGGGPEFRTSVSIISVTSTTSAVTSPSSTLNPTTTTLIGTTSTYPPTTIIPTISTTLTPEPTTTTSSTTVIPSASTTYPSTTNYMTFTTSMNPTASPFPTAFSYITFTTISAVTMTSLTSLTETDNPPTTSNSSTATTNNNNIGPAITTAENILSPTSSANISSPADTTNDSSSSNMPIIVAGVAGGLIVFFIFFIILCIFCVCKRKKDLAKSDDGPYKTLSSGDPNNLSVTNELAKLPNDEHNQVAEKPSSPSGGKGSQKPYFYTNPPRHSTESILDKTSLTDDLDSQKTPYVKLSPFTPGQQSEGHVKCIFSHQISENGNDEYSVPRSIINNMSSHQIGGTDGQYCVPRQNIEINESDPHQHLPDEQYSVPRHNNFIPTDDNQYSAPRQNDICNSISHHTTAGDLYSAPRRSDSVPHPDDLYSVPRQNVINDHQIATDDQYSVPRQSNSITHQVAADDQYSVPRHGVVSDHQVPCDDQYSVPRQSDSITHQVAADDQYSVPRQGVVNNHEVPADDLYSVPRQSDSITHQVAADDQYSVPRQGVVNNHEVPADDLYSVPRQSDSITHQVGADDQYSVPHYGIVNDHQITADDQYSVPRQSVINDSFTTADLYDVPHPSTINDSIIPHQPSINDQYSTPRPCAMDNSIPKPDEWYAAPRKPSKSDTILDVYAVPGQLSSTTIPHQVENDEQYAIPCQRVNTSNQASSNDDYTIPDLNNTRMAQNDATSGDDSGYGALYVTPGNNNKYGNLKNQKKKIQYANSSQLSERLRSLHKTNSTTGYDNFH